MAEQRFFAFGIDSTRSDGSLAKIFDCRITIPFGNTEVAIILDNLPDITDAKSASYKDESIIGRSSPIKTYVNSQTRTISMQLHFFVTRPDDLKGQFARTRGQTTTLSLLDKLRLLQSAVYPQTGENGLPFIPPPICRIRCGELLSKEGELCVVLKSYSVKFPTDVAWDEQTFTPFKFDVDTSWDVVYTTLDLPGQERILDMGK